MKKRLLTLILAVMFLFSGCSYSKTGIDGLLSPPKLSDQQNKIYNALSASVGKNIKLKYPRHGSFTSAFLINNIDNEPTQEAIVFYEDTANPSAKMPLIVGVLDQEDGKWVAKYDVRVPAKEVDKVSFITENNQTYMIIGFNVLSKAEKMIAMYTYSDGTLDEKFTTNCSDYEVFDIDNDKSSEIITFIKKTNESDIKTMTAYMHKINSGGTKIVSETKMDPNVIEYVKINKGKLYDDTPALYLDGSKGANTLCTEILVAPKGDIKNLIYDKNPKRNLINKTQRSYGSLSVDLDNNDVFDIPTPRIALGYEKMEQFERLYLTDWYNYRNEDLKLLKTTYISYSLGYVVTIPQKWLDKITIEPDSNEEVTFYDYESKINEEYDSKLLSIKVLQRAEYQKEAVDKGYTLLKDNGQIMYTYKIYNTNSKIKVSDYEVEQLFKLI